MTQKPLTPLQAMTRNTLSPKEEQKESFTTINPYEAENWLFHDRPLEEIGDIEVLAAEFKTIGQQQPCIVRLKKSSSSGKKYEIISGERRWRASLLAETDLKVIIKELTDEDAAIAQIAENSNRKDLSDYAKGINYSQLIKNKIIKQKDLTEKLNMSKQQVSRLLSFTKIPKEILSSIGDMSKVTARTSEQIVQLANKNPEHIKFICEMSDGIRDGKIGASKIADIISVRTNKKRQELLAPVTMENGQELYSWKSIGKKKAIYFSKEVSALITLKEASMNKLNKEISNVISKYLID